MLSVEHVTFGYKPKIKVIDDINFEVNKGLIMGLLGHNGAGKTTTLRLILGLLRPQSGMIEVDGYIPESPFIPRRLISYMPETSGVYERLTGFQNLEFRARAAGLDLKQIRTLSTTWLDQLGLLDRGHEKAGTWSKGLRQRLSLACALICQTSLLLLDEPTSGLDPESLSVFVRVLQDERDKGVTVVMSSHDLSSVRKVCDSITILHKGRVVYANVLQGTIESLEETYLELTKR